MQGNRSLALLDRIAPSSILGLYQSSIIKGQDLSLIMCEVHRVGKRGEAGVMPDL